MKKEIGAESEVCGKLRFEAVSEFRRFQFLLLEYRFFKDSEGGGALPLSLPWLLSPLSLVLHIVMSRALDLLRLPCYFVRQGERIVGSWAIQERHEGLVVANLGVAKKYRRLRIGTRILGCIEAIARRKGKRWLETVVWKKNIPAQRLYAKYGFIFIQSERMYYVMRKEICVDH